MQCLNQYNSFLLVWLLAAGMLSLGDKSQKEGPLARGAWWHGITALRAGAQFLLATPGDSAGARIHCRWICMDEFDSLVRDMLDKLQADRLTKI